MSQASHEFKGSVDFNQYELRNATFQRLLTPPISPVEGQIYYSSLHKIPFYRDSTKWNPFGIKPVHKRYINQAALLADQALQIIGYIYYNEQLDIYYEKLETSTTSLSDYNPLGGSGAFVPYIGAKANVNLGEYGLTSGFLTFDTTPTNTPTTQGTMFWDVDDLTVDIILNGYRMKIGEDIFYPVKNQTGTLIPKGTNVRFAGTLGASSRLLIAPFLANGSFPSSYYMGVTAENIADGADGKVLWFGRIRGINTNAFNANDILYASTTVAGGFQTTIPTAPNNIIEIAAVINKSTTQGVIFIRPQIGSNINRDEGVRIVSPTNNDVLLYKTATGLWENATLASISYNHPTYTPINQTLSGATVLATFTTDSIGSVTGFTTRTLTPANIGAEPSFSKGNIVQGNAITLTGTLTSRLIGTGDITIAHADTSSQANVSNTNGSVIQSVSVDTYGHVTLLSSVDLDSRYFTETEVNTLLTNYQLLSQKGVANGYVPLDSSGKIPTAYIPDSILGQVTYVGTWNATTNVPTLPSPTTVKGDYYIVTTAGTYLGTDYQIGDWIISDGVNWTKVDNSDSVSSVFGRTGNVVANEADYQSFYPRLSQTYANPTWISSLAWSKITGTPTTLAGYGITDAVPSNRTLTINGIAFDLTANRTWSVGTVTSIVAGTGLTGGTITTSGTIAHADTSTQATVTNTNGTIIQSLGFDDFGHVTSAASLDGDARWLRSVEVLNNQSVWSHVVLTGGIDITGYTTGSSGYPTTLGLSVAFYAPTSDSTSGFGRAFAFTRGYNTRSYYLGSPNTSGVHNGWDLIYTSNNLTLSTLGGVPTTRTITINGTAFDLSADRTWSVGTVTSVALSGGTTGLTVSGSPITGSGTITLAGTLIVANGGTGATTLTGIVVGNGTSAMTAVAGTASQLLRRNSGNTAYEFFTHDFVNQAGARSAISLTTTGTSGVATYSSATGVLNIPNYTYTHPTFTAFTPTLTGANVLSTFTTNTNGHVTAVTTRTLTAADIGAQVAGNYVTTDTTQTITGIKTFPSGSSILNLSNLNSTPTHKINHYLGTTLGGPAQPNTIILLCPYIPNQHVDGKIIGNRGGSSGDWYTNIDVIFRTDSDTALASLNLESTSSPRITITKRLVTFSGTQYVAIQIAPTTLGADRLPDRYLFQGWSTTFTSPSMTAILADDVNITANVIFTDNATNGYQLERYFLNGSYIAKSFIVEGGTSSQFLKADGSVDSNVYGLSSGDITAVSLTTATLTLTRAAGNLTASVPTFNQNTTGSAATLTTPRTLTIGSTGKTFNGSADISWSLAEIGAQVAGNYVARSAIAGQHTDITSIDLNTLSTGFTYAGSSATNRPPSGNSSIISIAQSALYGYQLGGRNRQLYWRDNENGVWNTWQRVFMEDFHPEADKWTTARTITIGSTGKSVDGTGNVSWSLAEMGTEPSFTKGSLIAGTNVSLSGTLTNRLVGTGDVTINVNGQVPVRQVFTYTSSNTFTLSQSNPTAIYVTLNGQVLQEGSSYDWTISGTTLTITTPLLSGDEISILYYTNLPTVTNYGRNIDGGAPNSVYLPIQNVDGGTP
jgi:hypothetical protein